MRSKKLLATLVVALTLVATGCGASTSNSSEVSSTSKRAQEIEEIEPARFSAKEVEISGISNVDYSCIITDHQTGKQYLYTWNRSVESGGASMVEIGTIDDANINAD